MNNDITEETSKLPVEQPKQVEELEVKLEMCAIDQCQIFGTNTCHECKSTFCDFLHMSKCRFCGKKFCPQHSRTSGLDDENLWICMTCANINPCPIHDEPCACPLTIRAKCRQRCHKIKQKCCGCLIGLAFCAFIVLWHVLLFFLDN